jgi:hypothetical protein
VNSSRYSRRAAAALILSSDPLGAALVGAAVELAGFRPTFALADESIRVALLRVRPSHVLMDCADAEFRDEAALGPALMTGARLFFFGREARSADVKALAIRYQVRIIVLPTDVDRLHEILSRRPSPIPEPSER